jgi:hypothetical protein
MVNKFHSPPLGNLDWQIEFSSPIRHLKLDKHRIFMWLNEKNAGVQWPASYSTGPGTRTKVLT